MMLRYSFFLFFLSSLYSVDIAITFDDHPMPNGVLFTAQKRTEQLLKACDNHQCKAVFFCIGNCCQKDVASVELIEKGGQFLANHSLTHPHLSALSLSEIREEIGKTDEILTPYSHKKKYFRYPSLDYGNRETLGGTQEKAEAVYKILQESGYTDGYVTIFTYDWHLNQKLYEALKSGKRIDYEKLKDLYLSFIKRWCEQYIKEYPKETVHALLFHANDLNALYLDDILLMIRQSGWNIVSPEKAFTDTSWREKIIKESEKFTLPPQCPSSQEIDEGFLKVIL